ncbi:hypothetical protein HAHE_30640 [Haloferula helveola]|uniref:DUF4833 domain-containing protein n=1 Tax=Haloferula helveola TaxID=490095 RepID=A0ABN6H686_9BACT|nr:hypothetical protein HAHE_30640 [Haloferula helveola]
MNAPIRPLLHWILGLACLVSPLHGDDFREWRDAVTGNTIVAKLIDKREGDEGLEAQLLVKDSRRASWVNVDKRLLPKEAAYIKEWVKPEERFKFIKFGYSTKARMDAAWFAVNTGNHGIRVSVEPTGKPSKEFVFPAKTKKTAYLPVGVFARNKSGVSLATVRVYNKESDLLLFVLRDLENKE